MIDTKNAEITMLRREVETNKKMIGDLSREAEKMKKMNESLVKANENLRAREGRKTQTLSRCIRVIRNVYNQAKIHRMAGKEEASEVVKLIQELRNI